MSDSLITADASKVSASEFLRMFRPRVSPERARLNIKFAQAFNLPINPDWLDIAATDQVERDLRATIETQGGSA